MKAWQFVINTISDFEFTKMIANYPPFIATWTDKSISQIFQDGFDLQSCAFACITCLDSSNPVSLLQQSSVLQLLANAGVSTKDSLIFPTSTLLENELYKNVFFGFDEIWFFPYPKFHMSSKPSEISIVGPDNISQGVLNELYDWLALENCSMAFGDGNGTNVIVNRNICIGVK